MLVQMNQNLAWNIHGMASYKFAYIFIVGQQTFSPQAVKHLGNDLGSLLLPFWSVN